jgi:D-arginine dehydrogenase
MMSLEEIHKCSPWTRNPTYPEPCEMDEEIVEKYGGADNDYVITSGMIEPDTADMDVNNIWMNMMRVAKGNGAELVSSAHVQKTKRNGSGWELDVAVQGATGSITADLVVNAAGAWGDETAEVLGTKKVCNAMC